MEQLAMMREVPPYLKLFFFSFFMNFCPGTMTNLAESINSDLQTFTTHTTLNTEQTQLAIKVSADN